MENNQKKELIDWLEEKTKRSFNSTEKKTISLWQREYEFEAIQLVCEDIIDKYSFFDVRRVDNVLFSYEKKGSDMVEAIKNDIKKRAEKEFEFNKVVEGLRLNRPLIVGETVFIKRWLDWGFSPNAIIYAANLSSESSNRVDFRYINKVLYSWKELELFNYEQIKAQVREENFLSEQKMTIRTLAQYLDNYDILIIYDKEKGIVYDGLLKNLQTFLDEEIKLIKVLGYKQLAIEI